MMLSNKYVGIESGKVLYHLITNNGRGNWKCNFLLQCAFLPGDVNIKPGARRFQAKTLRLRVKPGEFSYIAQYHLAIQTFKHELT